jgi:hypothetical protein
MHCPSGELKKSCIQISAVFRVSFILVLFHFLLFVICLFKGEVPSAINEGAWPLKILLSIGLYIVSFFIPNGFFKVYGYVAMGCSGLFMIYEIILLIDLAYIWNTHWVSSYESANEKGSTGICWLVLLFAFTTLFFGAEIVICILMYKYYSNNWWAMFLTTCTIVSAIIFTFISLSSRLATGSLFTCSIMFLFLSCLNASALMSDPKNQVGMLFYKFSLVFLFIILFYVSGVTSASRKKVQDSTQSTNKDTDVISRPGTAVMEKNNSAGMATKTYRTIDEDDEQIPRNTLATALFHLLMFFASFNLAMVLTN